MGLYENPASLEITTKKKTSFFSPIDFSGGELPVDKKIKKCDFSSFLWVWKHCWSRVNRCHLSFSFPFKPLTAFHFASIPLMFFSYWICFFSLSFHFAFMSFHDPSLCIKDTGLRKLMCSNRSGVYLPEPSPIFHSSFSFLLSFSYRFGSLCRLPSSRFMNMYMYIYIYKFCVISFCSYPFLGGQCIGSVQAQAKQKWNARGYYTMSHRIATKLKLHARRPSGTFQPQKQRKDGMRFLDHFVAVQFLHPCAIL